VSTFSFSRFPGPFIFLIAFFTGFPPPPLSLEHNDCFCSLLLMELSRVFFGDVFLFEVPVAFGSARGRLFDHICLNFPSACSPRGFHFSTLWRPGLSAAVCPFLGFPKRQKVNAQLDLPWIFLRPGLLATLQALSAISGVPPLSLPQRRGRSRILMVPERWSLGPHYPLLPLSCFFARFSQYRVLFYFFFFLLPFRTFFVLSRR